MLAHLMDLPGHQFWPDEVTLATAGPFTSLALVGHRQLTDACLLSLAQRHDGKLATLDRGIASLIADREQRTRWVESIG